MSASTASDEIVVRGEMAARAVRIDLAAPLAGDGGSTLNPTGPWAVDMSAALKVAREEGRAEGREEGRTEGRAESTRLAATLDGLADQLDQTIEELGNRLAREVTELALVIAEAVIGRELRCAEDLGAEAIARCLQLAPAVGAVVARLNPDDLEALGPIPNLVDRDLTVIADPDLARGDAVVVVDDTVIDGRLGLAMERVAEVLS